MKLLRRLQQAKADKVPAGWLTGEQLAKKEGYTTTQGPFFYILRDSLKAGYVERKIFRVVTAGNGLRKVPYYRYAA